MFKNYDKRGSVLLMVVGLLVILGTLGGTFLLVSSLDARQSKLLAGRGRAELIASGGVGKVVRILGEDLHFGPDKASAPYTAPNITGDDKYKFFMDHTSIDAWLYSTDHPSDVFGTGLGNGTLVSTESDTSGAAGDSYLVPTGEFSDDGEQYYIAVKVVDLSSLLSLNNGGEDYLNGVTDTSKLLKSPALIRLKEWMGSVYANIHKGRCGADSGGTNRPITDYDIQCGRLLMSTPPELNYAPYCIADEVYLRWLGTGRKADFGRVFDRIGSNSIGTNVSKRQMLTVTSSSRSLVRNPITGVISSRVDLSKANALDSAAKDAYYAQLVFVAGSDDGQGGGAAPGITKVIDNVLGGGFFRSHAKWLPIGSVANAYNGTSHRYKGTTHRAWWVFEGLPQANYRVWVSWGSPALPTGSNIPYMVYSGGVVAGGKYRGGTLKGTFVANQTKLPTDASFNGAHWQSLGSHWAEGRLAVEIHGPQGVPAGLPFDQIPFSFADAVRIEGVSLNLGSGSRPAAHLTANTWAAMSEYKPEKAFGYKPPGKDYTVFGIQEQPFITEAFATHTSRVQNPDMTWVEDSWKWGAAIELMNFSSREIDLKDYGLVFGTNLNNDTAVYRFPNGWKISAATNTKGGVLVLYDFGAGKGDVTADDVFGVNTGQWKQVEGLNFDKHTIRLVRIAKDDGGETYNIPIDHVGASTDPANHWAGGKEPVDLEYAQLTEEVRTLEQTDMALRTLAANSRRDDSLTKHRYSVAKYKKTGPNPPATHKLGQANAVTFPETTLKEGFRIKLPHGLLSGPGAISDLYLAGPILYDNASSAPADLPELLAKDYAIKESRGRANSHVKNDPMLNGDPWNVYPRQRGATEIPWPLVLGEVIETVPMDLGRGDSPTRVYGRININTASQEVLKQLPWPTGINAASGAAKIIAYRNSKGGFVTPGELALAMEGLTGNDAEGQPLDRDSIYAAISSCVTVNSDMYAVTVRVQLGASKTPAADRSWYYLAVIDRGCAMFSTDKPAVLLFTQLK